MPSRQASKDVRHPLWVAFFVTMVSGCYTLDHLHVEPEFEAEDIKHLKLYIAPVIDQRPHRSAEFRGVEKATLPQATGSLTRDDANNLRKQFVAEAKAEENLTSLIPIDIDPDVAKSFLQMASPQYDRVIAALPQVRYLGIIAVDAEVFSRREKCEDAEDSNNTEVCALVSTHEIATQFVIVDTKKRQRVLEANDKCEDESEYTWERSKTFTGGLWDDMISKPNEHPPMPLRKDAVYYCFVRYIKNLPGV